MYIRVHNYNITLTGNSDNAVLNKGNAIEMGKSKINAFEWYVPHYTPTPDQQRVLMKHVVDKTPTDLQYPEKSIFMKKVNTQNFWTVELGPREGVKIPIWIYVVLQQSDRQHDQNLNNDTFYRM